MKVKAIAVLTTVMLCIAGVANAKEIMVFGAGSNSCGNWLKDGGSVTERAWLQGYITSYNQWKLQVDDDVAKSTDASGMFAWMNNYCRSHPLDPIANAAAVLIVELVVRSGAH